MAKRWNHKVVARSNRVAEDVVRRIYAAAQTAKQQGLYGGYYADFLERSVGRRLIGAEYDVSKQAKAHLAYDPPGGYGGPKPTGVAAEPLRPKYGDPKVTKAHEILARAEREIDQAVTRLKDRNVWGARGTCAKDRDLLRGSADELCVAADILEEVGSGVAAGTLRERAKHARAGDYGMLESYRFHETKKTKAKKKRAVSRSGAARLDREIARFLGRSR